MKDGVMNKRFSQSNNAVHPFYLCYKVSTLKFCHLYSIFTYAAVEWNQKLSLSLWKAHFDKSTQNTANWKSSIKPASTEYNIKKKIRNAIRWATVQHKTSLTDIKDVTKLKTLETNMIYAACKMTAQMKQRLPWHTRIWREEKPKQKLKGWQKKKTL